MAQEKRVHRRATEPIEKRLLPNPKGGFPERPISDLLWPKNHQGTVQDHWPRNSKVYHNRIKNLRGQDRKTRRAEKIRGPSVWSEFKDRRILKKPERYPPEDFPRVPGRIFKPEVQKTLLPDKGRPHWPISFGKRQSIGWRCGAEDWRHQEDATVHQEISGSRKLYYQNKQWDLWVRWPKDAACLSRKFKDRAGHRRLGNSRIEKYQK